MLTMASLFGRVSSTYLGQVLSLKLKKESRLAIRLFYSSFSYKEIILYPHYSF